MATTIDTVFNDLVLTSDLDLIEATTDADSAIVQAYLMVTSGDTVHPVPLLSTTLYAYSGKVELKNLGSLVEAMMRRRGISNAHLTLNIGGVIKILNVLYCEYEMPDDFDPQTCFLTTSPVRRVHENSSVPLSFLSDGTVPLTIKIVGHRADGSLASLEKTVNTEPSGYSWLYVADIIDYATSAAQPLAEVSYFGVYHGQKSYVFFIVRHPFYLRFKFRNIFNALEYIDLPCTFTSKTSVDRDIAVCSGTYTQYNQQPNRTFEVQSGALPSREALIVDQLFNSREVYIVVGAEEKEYKIVINDHTCEVTNDNESLVDIKFSWQFSSWRPRLSDTSLSAFMPVAKWGIFDDHFTREYL